MKNEDAKKSDALRRIMALAITIALVAIGVLAFVYRDKLNAETLRDLFGKSAAAESGGEPYAYESGSKQVFALAGGNLAVVSTTGVQLLDGKGYTISRMVFPMSVPAVASGGGKIAVYDVGGTTLRVISAGGEETNLDSKTAIISVTMTSRGNMTVITDEAGSKGLVTVYDNDLEVIFQWYSGTGHALTARTSPDGKTLAAVTAMYEGGRVVFLDMETGEEKGVFLSYNELFFDAAWLSSDVFCIISEKRTVFLDSEGTPLGVYGFDDWYLAGYGFGGDGFIALLLCRYRTGSEGRLVTVGKDTKEIGELFVSENLSSISCAGGNIACLWPDSVILYSASLEEKGSAVRPAGVTDLLLREGGGAFLLMPYSAQICSF